MFDNQRFQQEAGKSHALYQFVCHALQFRAYSQDAESYPGNVNRNQQNTLGNF
jgi:hypothetical protein